MIRILLLCLVIFIGTDTFAQQALSKSSLGVWTGLSTYYGELNSKAFPASLESAELFDNLDYLTWGADYETYLGNAWGIGVSYTNAEFSASDRSVDWNGDLLRDEDNFNRSLNVNSKIQQLSLYGIWSGNDGKLFREAAFFSPFTKFGIGVLKFTPRGDLLSANDNIYLYNQGDVFEIFGNDAISETELDGNYETELRELNTEGSSYGDYSLSVLGGLGFNFRVSKKFSLQLGTDVRYTFTDNLDNVSGNFNTFSDPLTNAANNPANFDLNATRGESGNDWYAFTYVGARFYFGNRADEFKSPIVILGDLALGDTSIAQQRLFSFEPMEPLTPLEILPIPVLPSSLSTLDLPEISSAPPTPMWSDSDGDKEVPSIEDEGIKDVVILSDDSYVEEEVGILNQRTPTRVDSLSRPPQIVTTYPAWASEENYKISDSLSNAIKGLDLRLETLQPEETSTAQLDSITSAAFAKTSKIDSLQAELAALKSVAAKDSAVVKGVDTVFVDRITSASEQEENTAQIRTLEVELERLSQEVKDTEAYRERLIKQEENRFKLLEERDRQIAKEAKRDDQTQRKYDRGLLKNDEDELKAMRQLRSEQAALKFEVAKLSAQLAELAAASKTTDSVRVVVQPAPPVVQAPQVVQQSATDPVLVSELTGLRHELAALREAMSARPVPTPTPPVVVKTPVPTPSPVPATTAPARNLDAEVLNVLSQYGFAEVFFETGKSSVTAASMNSLSGLANGARQYPNRILVSLVGFTDKTGSLAANKALSERRVEAVRSALINLGVSPNQIRSSASGPDLNASDNASARRVEVTLRVR